MIDFQPFPLMDKSIYQQYLFAEKERGCELSYANLNMWGNHTATILHNHVLLLCCYSGRYMYPFPIGSGDKKPVLDRILSDAKRKSRQIEEDAKRNSDQIVRCAKKAADDYWNTVSEKYNRKDEAYNG